MFELIPFDRRMHRVSNYDPFREMDELFNNASRNIANPFATDVIDNGDSFELNAELPGFKKEDIKEIMKHIKAGYNVCLYPEGRHSYNGITMKQDDSIGKLVRISGAALVTYKIEGGYFLKPRWSRFKRTGPISGHVTGVYSSEELKNKTPKEITEIINKGIYEDAYLTQEKYKYKKDIA